MKKLKWGLLAFLTGELLTIFRTDAKFKREFQKKKGRDKLSAVFQKLVDFNKELITDTRDHIKNEDFGQHLENAKQFAHKELETLSTKIQQAKEKIESLETEKANELIGGLKDQVDALTQKAEGYIDELNQKYDLSTKLATLKKQLDEMVEIVKKRTS